MLSEVEVRTAQGDLLIMPLADLTDGISVQDISGLDPVEATIVTSNIAQMNGSQYHASSREDRELKFKLGMDEEPGLFTVEEVRDRLYAFFMPTSPVDFTFRTSSGKAVDISGRVKSFVAPLFVPEPVADITIECFEGDFVDKVPVVINDKTTVSDTTTFDIDYKGNVSAGIRFELFINRTITEFTIYSQSADGILRQLDFAAPMSSGQTLTIETFPGSKSAMISSGGSPTPILYGVSPHATWLELQRGLNTIRVYAEGAAIPFTITYFKRYGGL